jgi:hypothetical protein
MLRIQLPERSSFRFGRKSYIEAKGKDGALEDTDTDLKIPPHVPLPLVHHTSTQSLFDLFQSQSESAYGLQTMKNENKAILSPTSAKTMPGYLEKPVLGIRTVSTPDALGSHRNPNLMSSMPTTAEHEHSTSSTPSSGFREDDNASGCSRKSSTSSVGTPLAGHKAYFEAMAALEKETGVIEIPLLGTFQQLHSPKGSELSPTRSVPQYDKPLPPPPSPERPFGVSSVLSIMRAESFSKAGQQPPMQMVADAPIIFRRPSQARPGHGRSVSDGVLRSKVSTTSKVKSATTSPKSKRGTRLGNAMKEGRSHNRAQTLSNITILPPGSKRPEKPRPLSMSFNNISSPTHSKNWRNLERKSEEESPISISPDAAEKVVFEIMRRLDEPADLLASAAINRGFRGTFKRAEPRLVHDLLLRQCPAAWEFQKNSVHASGEALSLRAYTKDKAALTFIKSALLASCGSVLQLETVGGLDGTDLAHQSRIDAALWRIWTFCKGFGHRSLSEEDIPIQVDWLNGGRIARKRRVKTAVGRGNRKGVSVTDLEDLLQLWDLLGMMLSGGNNDLSGARAAGIFEKCIIDENHTEEWFLEEWTYYIRSLGLPAVLTVSSATSFEELQVSSFTNWTPPSHGQTRAGFFRAAVSSVYQERILAEAATKATQFALPPRSLHRPCASDASVSSLEQLTRALEKRAAQQQSLKIITSPTEVRRKPIRDSSMSNTTWQPETPDTPYPVQRHSRQSSSEHDQREHEHNVQRDSLRDSLRYSLASPIRNSVVLQSLGMTSTASTRLGATLFPMEYPTTSPQNLVSHPFSSAHLARPPRGSTPPPDDFPPVIDPVDKAMKLLTQDMCFSAAEASRALARCDTGFGIDVQKAIEMLARESGRDLSAALPPRPKTPVPTSPVHVSTPTSPANSRKLRDSCSGHHERSLSNDSTPSAEPTKPFEPLCDTHPVRQPSLLGNLNRNSLRSLTRMGSKAKAYTLGSDRSEKSLGAEESRPPRVSSLKATQDSVERPWQPLPASQRPKSKMPPPRKAKSAHKSKLMGIDEEPTPKAMQVLGVDEVEIVDGRMSPAVGGSKSKSKPAKRFYEGRFSNLGWSDAGSAK